MANLEKVLQYLDSIKCRHFTTQKPCCTGCSEKGNKCTEYPEKCNNLEKVLQNLECIRLMDNIGRSDKFCCTMCQRNIRGMWPSNWQIFEYNEFINSLKLDRFNATMNELEDRLAVIRSQKETICVAEYFSQRKLDLSKVPIEIINLVYSRNRSQVAYEKMAQLDELLNTFKR
jgi:hypothetical protein